MLSMIQSLAAQTQIAILTPKEKQSFQCSSTRISGLLVKMQDLLLNFLMPEKATSTFSSNWVGTYF